MALELRFPRGIGVIAVVSVMLAVYDVTAASSFGDDLYHTLELSRSATERHVKKMTLKVCSVTSPPPSAPGFTVWVCLRFAVFSLLTAVRARPCVWRQGYQESLSALVNAVAPR